MKVESAEVSVCCPWELAEVPLAPPIFPTFDEDGGEVVDEDFVEDAEDCDTEACGEHRRKRE